MFCSLWLGAVADFEALNCLSPQSVIGSTKLHLTTEPALGRCCLLSIVTAVLVRWLGSSFAFFALGLCVGKNANVLPNALAYVSLNNCPSVNRLMSIGVIFVKSDLNLTSETLSGILILSTFEMS